jgi:hypothetical protein
MHAHKSKAPFYTFQEQIQHELVASASDSIPLRDREREPFVISIMVVLRFFAFASGVAVAAYEWSHYKNGRICARYVPSSSPYHICASTPWQLSMLTVTRYMAGEVNRAIDAVTEPLTTSTKTLYVVSDRVAGVILASLLVVLCSKLHTTRRVIQNSFVGSLIDFEPT